MTEPFSPPERRLKSDPEAHQRGTELLAQLHGGHTGEQLVASLASVCPDFTTMTIEWSLAGIMGVLAST